MKLLIVIHETIISCDELLTFLQSPTFKASYHVCIDTKGTVVYLVPPEEKAYAAANSKFINIDGQEESINNSVDDFAYHIALETPNDGRDSTTSTHSGYTNAQYKSLAWLISKTGRAFDRVVTHGDLKTPKTLEPRTLDLAKVLNLWLPLKKEKLLDFGVLE